MAAETEIGWHQVKRQNGVGEHQSRSHKMEDDIVKVKENNKRGPLKSTPGFLKCMRNVYLYFKEEKEKGALNIPINSFIERTAVACGVGRKTLYNYAKKGLFDERPTFLFPPKQKKKRGRKKLKSQEDSQVSKKGKGKSSSPVEDIPGPSNYKKKGKNVMIQTDLGPVDDEDEMEIQEVNAAAAAAAGGGDEGYTNFIIRDQNRMQEVQLAPPNKTQVLAVAPWVAQATSVTRDIDYLPKNNIWHAVYNVHTTEAQPCNAGLTTARIPLCQQQTASDHLNNMS